MELPYPDTHDVCQSSRGAVEWSKPWASRRPIVANQTEDRTAVSDDLVLSVVVFCCLYFSDETEVLDTVVIIVMLLCCTACLHSRRLTPRPRLRFFPRGLLRLRLGLGCPGCSDARGAIKDDDMLNCLGAAIVFCSVTGLLFPKSPKSRSRSACSAGYAGYVQVLLREACLRDRVLLALAPIAVHRLERCVAIARS
jgi:hypothetical protein